MMTIMSCGSFAQSPPIRVRATFLTYAKSMAALAKGDCHHSPEENLMANP